MKYDYLDLFIPNVKTYGFVFKIQEEPILFIIHGKNVLDGIPISWDFDEFESEDEEIEEEIDIYTLLDNDETILVGVEVLDDDFNVIKVKDINDDNYDEFIYNLLPLKMHTLDFKQLSIEDITETDKLKKILLKVVSDYKKILKLSK